MKFFNKCQKVVITFNNSDITDTHLYSPTSCPLCSKFVPICEREANSFVICSCSTTRESLGAGRYHWASKVTT